MKKVTCTYCGSEQYEERKIEYLYSHEGKYLLVPDTPVEVCLNCGMVFYDAMVLKKIEHHFFAIHHESETPDRYINIPANAFS